MDKAVPLTNEPRGACDDGRMAEYGDRVRGALLGGAIGDALGWPIEFLRLTEIRARFGPAGLTEMAGGVPYEITDDTQMTLFTAEALLRWRPGSDPAPPLRDAYLRWLRTQRATEPRPDDGWLAGHRLLYAVRAPGNACLSGLERQRRALAVPHRVGKAGPVNPDSKGCGAVMRSAPFGLAGFDPEMAFAFAARGGQLTHGHPTGYIAAGAFAALIARLVRGDPFEGALRATLTQLADVPGAEETTAALQRARDLADAGPPTAERVEEVGAGWTGEECLAVAVHCALHAARDGDARAALLLSVNHSGDSDSTGSVTGNLLGATLGLAALPAPWTTAVEARDLLLQVADDLVTAFQRRTPDRLRYPLS